MARRKARVRVIRCVKRFIDGGQCLWHIAIVVVKMLIENSSHVVDVHVVSDTIQSKLFYMIRNWWGAMGPIL